MVVTNGGGGGSVMRDNTQHTYRETAASGDYPLFEDCSAFARSATISADNLHKMHNRVSRKHITSYCHQVTYRKCQVA
jgi:hypothetical protein